MGNRYIGRSDRTLTWEVVGCKVEKSLLLSDIYETPNVSAGLFVAPESDAIRMMLAEGRSLIHQRNAREDRAVELLGGRPDYQLLRTIPGIGPINALTILAEAGDLRRFRHHRQFLKFCGMDLPIVQSAMFSGRSEISKYGNAHRRHTLWLAGQTTVIKKTNSCHGKEPNVDLPVFPAIDAVRHPARHYFKMTSPQCP